MGNKGITVLGLGPGTIGSLTREAWSVLSECDQIWVRTASHPVVDFLPEHIQVHSFDYLYEEHDSFEMVYEGIIDRVMELGQQSEGVVYAVPGHPYVAEQTSPEIIRRARQIGLEVRIIDGLSFLEPLLSALGVDPFPQTVLIDALQVVLLHVPPFPPTVPVIVAQLYSRQVASDVKLTLMEVYPDEHPVMLVHEAGTSNELIEKLPLYLIDRSNKIGALSSLYVPPLSGVASFEDFQEVVAHLRAPQGCPWDRQQTHASLRTSLLEESYEAVDAIDRGDMSDLMEELGDLLLLIFMHTQIAIEEGEFNLTQVVSGIHDKIVYRHPHVFGDLQVENAGEVLINWERMKAEERANTGKSRTGLLDSVSLALPALLQADEYQQRAARVGFDWPAIEGVWDKLLEELEEIKDAGDRESRSREIGDLLFAVVNLARWYGIEAEDALREANTRFRKRFTLIELTAREQGRDLTDLTLDEMEALWQEAKRQE